MSGGLGPAFYGISEALSKKVDLLVVIPKAHARFKSDGLELLGLNHLELSQEIIEEEVLAFEKELSFTPNLSYPVEYLNVELNPYQSDKTTLRKQQANQNRLDISEFLPKKKLVRRKRYGLLTDDPELYGPSIMQKVALFTELVSLMAHKWEFDLIHAHDWVTFPAAVKLKEITGKPLLTHIHSLETDRSGYHARNKVYEIELKAMNASDVVFPVSEYTRTQIQTHYSVLSQTVPIPNGVENNMQVSDLPSQISQTNPEPTANERSPIEQQPPASEDGSKGVARIFKELPKGKVVTFLGRLTYQKNPHTFLKTAEILTKRMLDVHFVIAGSGELLRPLIQEAKSLGIIKNITFTGYISRAQVKELISISDAFFLPSVSEPFGLSALEAVQNGLPVVISRQSGVGQYLSGTLKADYWDAPRFAEYLFGLLSYPAVRRDTVQINQSQITNLDWDKAADLILENYEKLLQ
jgi:glycosyltransferase involved in cell wall biosynthesis